MTKEELEKEAEELYEDWYAHKLGAISIIGVICKMAEPREKRITELEEKISILLSCKNCPENKGGLICAKEYENKCLAQKIEFIKELQEENAELKDEWQEQVQKANDEGYARTLQTIQLTKAKDHIKKLLDCLKQDTNDPQTNYYVCQYMDKAEQFLREVEK